MEHFQLRQVVLCVLFLGPHKAPGIFKQRPPISVAPSSPLLPLHEEVEALLFLSEGKPYLLEVCNCCTEDIYLHYFLLFEQNSFVGIFFKLLW